MDGIRNTSINQPTPHSPAVNSQMIPVTGLAVIEAVRTGKAEQPEEIADGF